MQILQVSMKDINFKNPQREYTSDLAESPSLSSQDVWATKKGKNENQSVVRMIGAGRSNTQCY